jgi:serine protease Do
MKRPVMNKILIAAVALLAAPAGLLAQQQKQTDKKDVQQIIVTRTGDKNEKTVIEIVGDKVKINGKDATDNNDVRVNVNNMKGATVYSARTPGGFGFTFDDNVSLFKEDANRAMLGVTTEGADAGAEVLSVTKESAADKAGLKKGDIITRIGDKKIESSDDVTETVRAHKPGDKVTLNITREGKEQKLTAELGKWRGIPMNAVSAMPKISDLHGLREFSQIAPSVDAHGIYNSVNGFAWGRPRLGVSIQDTDDGKGVKVLDVDEEGYADKAGLKKDDIILQVDDKAITAADDVSKLMKDKKEGSTTRLEILRQGKPQTIEVKFPKKLKTVDL